MQLLSVYIEYQRSFVIWVRRWKMEEETVSRNFLGKCKTKVTYFCKGMCAKGPSVGIVPHKSLFDTSLMK